MTAAFAVAAAVAVVAILALVLTTHRGAAHVARERSHADRLAAELAAAQQARPEAEPDEHQQEGDPAAPEERADVSGQPAADPQDRRVAADTLWELERLRLEREWQEVTGTPAPLPEPWDGSIRAAIAVELEIIREVIGIPTRLEPDGHADPGPGAGEAQRAGLAPAHPASPTDPMTALGTARLTGEVLRSLARVGEEMVVTVEPDGSVTMMIETDGAAPGLDLTRLTGAAAALGGELAVRPLAGGVEARLRPPAPPP